ncbi:hypothetical protein N7445_002513 [Penicillium cf. griseofulvum]|nr:hypothetical protein N7445_002513 [Penicillium cf. griseofulvum]
MVKQLETDTVTKEQLINEDRNFAHPDAQGEPLGMVKQLETDTVTKEQLINEDRNFAHPDAQGEPLGMVKQLETDTVTKEQLINKDRNFAYPDAQGEPLGIVKQLETNRITKEQLINEVRVISAKLVILEKRCIESHRQSAQSNAELSPPQLQELVSLHTTLLYEYLDFFLTSQHPSAGPILRDLAQKYAMPEPQ